MKDEPMQPVDLWIERYVYELVKSHSDKFPYYNADIKILQTDHQKDQVQVQVTIDGKGRNEIQQNLCLLLINSLKG